MSKNTNKKKIFNSAFESLSFLQAKEMWRGNKIKTLKQI